MLKTSNLLVSFIDDIVGLGEKRIAVDAKHFGADRFK